MLVLSIIIQQLQEYVAGEGWLWELEAFMFPIQQTWEVQDEGFGGATLNLVAGQNE